MAKCDIPNTNPLDKECSIASDATDTPTSSCVESPSGMLCPQTENCSPWDLANLPDSCFVESVIEESLNIGGAIINVHKLLGVHEQGKLLDLTGNGSAISNGDIPNYPADNAFDKYITEWRSVQTGSEVVASAYIGYDFGEIKLSNGRDRYGVETFIRQDVATLKLKQGCNSANRATKVRVERSSDGTKWYGVAILDVPDCDGMVTLNFKRTVPSRWWRVRPVKFNGSSTDWWSVQALQLIDYEATQVSNIQDRLFLENRDRDYSKTTIEMKGSYTPIDIQTFQSKFGMSQLFGGNETYAIEVSFAQAVTRLGRPFVIGDIIQLPSETQYSPSLKPILKYLEITDIGWSAGSYTANWKPTMQRILAEPVIASQETQDVMGKLTQDVDNSGLSDINDGSDNFKYQDKSAISDYVKADANNEVPERGTDYGEVTQLSEEMKVWQDLHPNVNVNKLDRVRDVYGLDALPPNGLPYTEGDQFPTSPSNGDYHRLTYSYINNNIPPRLHKYSAAKQRWVYLETDRRFQMKNTKPVLQEFIDPETSTMTKPQDMNTDANK